MATNETTKISRMELTPWDLRLLRIGYIQRGLLFFKPKSQDFEKNFIIDHLKDSLSRTLYFFPPLSGRLGSTKNSDNTMSTFYVDCNNAGVEFTHAIARGIYLSDIVDPTYTPQEIVSSFFPLNGLVGCQGISNPLLGVQVTELVDGYFLACTANHSVVDGISYWHFINSWSEISRGLDKISKSPVFERSFPSLNIPNIIPIRSFEEQNLLNNIVSPPLLERFFRFSKESIAKLKAKANSEAGTDKISSFQALTAHLWRSVIRCRTQTQPLTTKLNVASTDTYPNHTVHSYTQAPTTSATRASVTGQLLQKPYVEITHDISPINQQVCFELAIGARPRIPLPDCYFGCAVYPGSFTTTESELLQNGLGWAALKINEFVSKQTSEEACKVVENWLKNRVIMTLGINNFFIISSPRHNVYGNDFGWGKPVAVKSGMGLKFDGCISVLPSAEPGGIDAEVCLSPKTMKAMGDDVEFMEAVTI
ncbi:hypothetical protein ACJIZ3_003350 [Penstemon smallii]|uniref:Uncharacterized protein n=1 Tax=Penstemon smallii TaxID=265156 RepID=A0ABD3UCD5_9LAMI